MCRDAEDFNPRNDSDAIVRKVAENLTVLSTCGEAFIVEGWVKIYFGMGPRV